MIEPIDSQLLTIARGEAPADLLLTNARVVNVISREIETANIAIRVDEQRNSSSVRGGRIAGVGDYTRGKRVIDVRGSYVAPGFIDAHMHVESTMLPPSEFVTLAAPHGTTGVVLDPHEIANVLGVPGIRYLMEDARRIPLTVMFALSSCVPSSHLETSGARLDAEDLAPLFDEPNVVALAEVMNYPGVVNADAGVLAKVAMGLSRGVVDGHAPGLRGRPLQAYIAAGITSDHECTTAEEAHEKLRRGMHIFIREGSAARNLESLHPLINESTAHHFSFCTDDRHPADLRHEGHIDHVIRKAVKLGISPITAIAVGSLHTARHFRMSQHGAIAPGYFADLVVFDDLGDIRPRMVFHRGSLVAEEGGYIAPMHASANTARLAPPTAPLRLPADLRESSFRIRSKGGRLIRVIGMNPHQIVTESLVLPARVQEGCVIADAARDMLKLAVIERHRGTGNIGLGFAHGFGIRHGALASTVGHDSHNLAVVGSNDADMLAAARALEACGGGQCVAQDGLVRALLPLPIAGLMSDASADMVIEQQRRLLDAAEEIGCPHADPFMPLSFLPLPVIPKLKLTDLGLVDVERFEVVSLEL